MLTCWKGFTALGTELAFSVLLPIHFQDSSITLGYFRNKYKTYPDILSFR